MGVVAREIAAETTGSAQVDGQYPEQSSRIQTLKIVARGGDQKDEDVIPKQDCLIANGLV